MKTLFSLSFLVLLSFQTFPQNITNTLGTDGIFTVKDASTIYLTLYQSNGLVGIAKNLTLTETPGSQTGILFKGADRFLHTYSPAGSEGYNTFLGLKSGNFTMSGSGTLASYNTDVGNRSLTNLTIGYCNSAFGSNSLSMNNTGHHNSAFGDMSLCNNTSGSHNSAFGIITLYTNTTGYENSAYGSQSLRSNTTGNNNSAFGYKTLLSNTTGNYNSAFGNSSLLSNILGGNNSAFGYFALTSNTTGSLNSAFGYYSLYYNSTGIWNTAIGTNAGTNITTGNNNTAIGNDAQIPDGTLNDQVRIGNTYVTYAGVEVAWTITSDRRWKQNILPSNLGLNFISQLNPVSYTRKNDERQKTEYGFIAQEIEEVLKENNVDKSGMITITNEGMYELRYNDLLAPMVKSIQELKTENDELRERLSKLEQYISDLQVEGDETETAALTNDN